MFPASRLFLAGVGLLTVVMFGWDYMEAKAYLGSSWFGDTRDDTSYSVACGSDNSTAHHIRGGRGVNADRVEKRMEELFQRLDRLEAQLQNQKVEIPDELGNIRKEAHDVVEESRGEVSAALSTAGNAKSLERLEIENEAAAEAPPSDTTVPPPPLPNEMQQQDDNTPSEALEATPAADTSTTLETATIPVQIDSDNFDPRLSIEDYEFLEHSRPSEDWMRQCAAALYNDTDVQQKFAMAPGVPWGYALGDCIKLCNKCTIGLRKRSQNGPMKVPENYSMASSYEFMSCPVRENFTVVDQIFRNFEQAKPGVFTKPDKNDLVIHLRLGDVIEHTGKKAQELLMKGGVGAHPETKKKKLKSIHGLYDYLDIIESLQNDTEGGGLPTKIHIIGGSHKDNKFGTSKVYAHCIQRGIAKAGYKVDMFIEGRDPDEDFYFVSHAKRLVISTGGYSRLMGKMAVRNGGKLVGPDLASYEQREKVV